VVPGDWFIVFLALFAVGLIGFFVMAVVLVLRVLRAAGRALFGPAHGSAVRPPPLPGADRQVCPHERCGHVNRGMSRFCARCGRPLRRPADIDAYG
jgi:hypothetical protein